MVKREVKDVLESYRDADGVMRYALKGAIIDDDETEAPAKPAPKKRGRPPRK